MAPEEDEEEGGDDEVELSEFVVWRLGAMSDGVCKLNDAEGIERSFEIDEGKPRLATWSDDVVSRMDPRFPKDIELADSLFGANFLVVSGKVKALLEAEGIGRIEYLPLKILNHKDRVASSDYFILNPLDVIDCLDAEASGMEENPILAGRVLGVEQLILDESKVPADKHIFRIANWPSRIMIRRPLSEKMKDAGLTGLLFIDPYEYAGLN